MKKKYRGINNKKEEYKSRRTVTEDSIDSIVNTLRNKNYTLESLEERARKIIVKSIKSRGNPAGDGLYYYYGDQGERQQRSQKKQQQASSFELNISNRKSNRDYVNYSKTKENSIFNLLKQPRALAQQYIHKKHSYNSEIGLPLIHISNTHITPSSKRNPNKPPGNNNFLQKIESFSQQKIELIRKQKTQQSPKRQKTLNRNKKSYKLKLTLKANTNDDLNHFNKDPSGWDTHNDLNNIINSKLQSEYEWQFAIKSKTNQNANQPIKINVMIPTTILQNNHSSTSS